MVGVTGEATLPDGWMAPFAEKLADLEAVTELVDVETGAACIDVAPLVNGAGLLVGILVDVLASRIEADRLAVVHTLREHIEQEL